DHLVGREVEFAHRQNPFEQFDCFAEVARAIGFEPPFVEGYPTRRRAPALYKPQQFVDGSSLRPTVDRNAVELANGNRVACFTSRRLADDDAGAIESIRPLDPAREIHRVADGRIVQPRVRAYVADKTITGVAA